MSQSTGNDANPGTPGAPWKTLAKVNATTFPAGSTVYLARGDTWLENLTASGDDLHFDAYGSGALPLIDGEDVRENLLLAFGRSGVTFRNLEVQNTRTDPNAGYGVLLQNCLDCLVEDVVTRNNAKHGIGFIQSHRATARRCKGFDLQPGLGFGSATMFVSYGEGGILDNVWEDCESTTGFAGYPTFITHGSGVRNLTLTNLVEHTEGSAVALFCEDTTRVVATGGTWKGLTINAGTNFTFDNVTVDGISLLGGEGHAVRNCTLTYLDTNWQGARPGVVVLVGTGMLLLNNTIHTGLNTGNGGCVAVGPNGGGALQGNTLIGDIAIRIQYDGPISGFYSDHNVWCSIAVAQQGSGSQTGYTLAQWQALGFDVHSTSNVCA